ncbi:peptidylprolyl isomerase [Hydrocarboniphaga sp.]|uniref:peptidylprolyl isomerase n=1 Tax=Hydrocarboniphaga sp. TaxID=2033016 RepID=UPI003D11046E
MAFPKKLVAPVAALWLMFNGPAHAETLDRIVAVVNDSVVLQSELDQAMRDAQSQIKGRGVAVPAEDVLRPQVLERVIVTRLQTQRAQQAGIRVDDRELNDVMTNIARQNKMTLAQLADSVKEDGLDFLNVREQIRDEVLISRLRQKEVESRIQVTDQDVDLYLANQSAGDNIEYHLAHILVSIPDGASSEERDKRRAKAQGLLKRVRGGEDFAQIAITSSDGQQALQGGDLDWRKAADLPSLFATTAAKLKAGETSDVLETGSGFHIIKLEGTRGGEERLTVNETHALHILLMNNALRTEDQSRVQAQDIYDRLQKGGDFAKLAKEFSDDPGSKNNGGDLGWQPPGVFAPEFQVRIDQLQPNEVSTPFHTQFGWHVAKVLERRVRDTTEESRRGRARQAIQQRRSAEEYETWLRRLRDEAYIEYRLGKSDPTAAGTPAAAAPTATP